MGCRASRRIAPEGIPEIPTVTTLRPIFMAEAAAEGTAAEVAGVSSWAWLCGQHLRWDGGDEERAWARRLGSTDVERRTSDGDSVSIDGKSWEQACVSQLDTAGVVTVWDDASLEVVAVSVLAAKRTTRVNLSPRLRAQLWLAFSRVDARSSAKGDFGDERYVAKWDPDWYADALARADSLQAASHSPDNDSQKRAFTVIDNDVPRTLHNFADFVYPNAAAHGIAPPTDEAAERGSLARVLRAFCIVCPDVNYTQGMNFIAALMLRVLWFADCEVGIVNGAGAGATETPDVADKTAADASLQGAALSPSSETPTRRRERRACGMLRVLATDMGMGKMWRVGFPLLDAISESLMDLLKKHEPDIAGRLMKNGLPTSSYTTSWLITLFTSGPTLKFASPADVMLWWDLLWVECCRPRVTRLRKEEDAEQIDPPPAAEGWRQLLTGAGSSTAASTYLLRTTYATMLCHKDAILRARDIVEIMTELQRGLSSDELWQSVFLEGTTDDEIVADKDGKWKG